MKAIWLYLFFFKVINNAALKIDHNILQYVLPKSIFNQSHRQQTDYIEMRKPLQ